MSATAALLGVAIIALVASGFVWLRRKMDRIYDGLD